MQLRGDRDLVQFEQVVPDHGRLEHNLLVLRSLPRLRRRRTPPRHRRARTGAWLVAADTEAARLAEGIRSPTASGRCCICSRSAAEENRFASLQRSQPETAQELDELEQTDVDERWARLELMLVGQDAPGSSALEQGRRVAHGTTE